MPAAALGMSALTHTTCIVSATAPSAFLANHESFCYECRLPRLVTATSACALMLRLSLVNLQGASGLAQDTYKFVAVSLTLATVCTSFAQLLQASQTACPTCSVRCAGCIDYVAIVQHVHAVHFGCCRNRALKPRESQSLPHTPCN